MNILENDTTEFIEQSIIDTRKEIEKLEGEIGSCNDYVEDAEDELLRRKN